MNNLKDIKLMGLIKSKYKGELDMGLLKNSIRLQSI